MIVNDCGRYYAKPTDDKTLRACNQFLGPTQPGVTTPDPTRTAASATGAAPRRRPRPRRHRAAPPARRGPAAAGLLDYLLAP